MNQFKEIYNTIEKLLNDKSISNYRINQDTGVSYGGISELRSGKRKVNNLTLETAEKLYNYQKQLEIMIVKSRLLCKMLYNVFTISTYQN